MTKAPVKRKQKQKQKQKVIQKTKVSQNVKVIIGDVKRKQAKRRATAKPTAKPNITLNITNPQTNPYFQYFKEQMMNQQPVQATTLRQNEVMNEREENKASKAGALHRLDQEPDDVARAMRAQAVETRANMARAEAERNEALIEMRRSLKPVSRRVISPTPLRPRPLTPKEMLMAEIRGEPVTPQQYTQQYTAQGNEEEQEEEEEGGDADMINAIEQQRNQMEVAMTKAGTGAGAGAIPSTPIRAPKEVEMPQTAVQSYEQNPKGTVTGKQLGRPKGSTNRPKEVIEAEKAKKAEARAIRERNTANKKK